MRVHWRLLLIPNDGLFVELQWQHPSPGNKLIKAALAHCITPTALDLETYVAHPALPCLYSPLPLFLSLLNPMLYPGHAVIWATWHWQDSDCASDWQDVEWPGAQGRQWSRGLVKVRGCSRR